MSFRTDRNNNPTAFTTDVAFHGGLVKDVDYTEGDSFTYENVTYYTAKLLGDPIAITIKLIDKIGFYTQTHNFPRWSYISIKKALWDELSYNQKKAIIGIMYLYEGGTEMKGLFA